MDQNPTEKELEILQIIWENGPSTVRFVNDQFQKEGDVGYTTTLKLMQIMTKKGILKRDTTDKNHIYHAVVQKKKMQNVLTQKFINKVFKGSASQLVLQVLGNSGATEKEIEEVKQYITKIENKS